MPPHYNMFQCRLQRCAKFSDGVPGDPGKPLGAQALCLCRNGRVSYCPLQGGLEPWTMRRPARNGGMGELNDRAIRVNERVLLGV